MKNSPFKQNGAQGTHSIQEREPNDYYGTPPACVEELLKKIKLNKDVVIYEPACGEGAISKVLINNGFNVISTDLIDRGFGTGNVDFLKTTFDKNVNIITNPPYKNTESFVYKALNDVKEGNYVIMLLKLNFLEGIKRYELFEQHPPKAIYVFSNRIGCGKNGELKNKYGVPSAIAYAWFVWQVGYKGKPEIEWIKF